MLSVDLLMTSISSEIISLSCSSDGSRKSGPKASSRASSIATSKVIVNEFVSTFLCYVMHNDATSFTSAAYSPRRCFFAGSNPSFLPVTLVLALLVLVSSSSSLSFEYWVNTSLTEKDDDGKVIDLQSKCDVFLGPVIIINITLAHGMTGI